MTKWAVVENGNITEYYDVIPNCWRNVSNINLLETEIDVLNSLGWYQVNDTTPILGSNQSFGKTTYTFDQQNKVVIKNTIILDNPPQPTQDQQAEFTADRNSFMDALRQQRNLMLTQSDWTQLKDIHDQKTSDWQQSWLTYRQALRNLPEVYETTYPNETNFHNIAWPNPPGA